MKHDSNRPPEAEPIQTETFTAEEKSYLQTFFKCFGIIIDHRTVSDGKLVDLCDEIAMASPPAFQEASVAGIIMEKARMIKEQMLSRLESGRLIDLPVTPEDTVTGYIIKCDDERAKFPIPVRMKAVGLEMAPCHGDDKLRDLDPADNTDCINLPLCERLIAVQKYMARFCELPHDLTMGGFLDHPSYHSKDDPFSSVPAFKYALIEARKTMDDPKTRVLFDRTFGTMESIERLLHDRGVLLQKFDRDNKWIDVSLRIAQIIGNKGKA